MRARSAVLLLFTAVCVYAQSSSFVWDYSGPGGTSSWNGNGDTTFASSSGGSYIWAAAVSGANSNDYEVNTTLVITPSYYYGLGGTYMHFLRANSTSVTPGNGSYISVEFAVPSTWTSGSAVPMVVNQCVSGTVTALAGTSVPLHNGDTVRSVVWGTTLWVFINNIQYGIYTIPATTGQPGYGGYGIVAGSGSFSTVKLGHHDTVAPNAVIRTTVATTLLPYSASLKWQGVADDSVGIGVFEYQISRGGTAMATIYEPEFTDATALPSTAYT